MPFKAYTPFELGEIAHNQNLPIESNPFQEGTHDWNEWNVGYLVARAAEVA